MSNLQIIERLCELLDGAQQIIRDRAALLEQYGIETDDGTLERERAALLDDIKQCV